MLMQRVANSFFFAAEMARPEARGLTLLRQQTLEFLGKFRIESP